MPSPGRVPIFRPDASTVSASQLTAFVRFCEAATGRRFADHGTFHEFSVTEYRRFWRLFLEWSGLLHDGSPERVCTDDSCELASFFPDLRLSYAEHLLRIDSAEEAQRTAIVAHSAFRAPERLTRGDLRDRVRALASQLRRLGVEAGDRVVAAAGNNVEVIVVGLAAAAVGATFSVGSPDMGAPALLRRFQQLRPKVLAVNLTGGGRTASTDPADRLGDLVRDLRSLAAVIALDDGPEPPRSTVPIHRLSTLLASASDEEADAVWQRFPFDHPLFILFSSGTTGRPKCIVHGAGGTLLEHLKEHRLHVDLRPGEKLFFNTSAAWMMWNWQLSALASGCEIVLYDGPITGPDALWRIVSSEAVAVFGTSPTYLQLCQDSGFSPRRDLALPNLRAVLSTGSILHDWQYDWVREHVGRLPVQSISGGTDIVGCFVLGNPNLPVHRGQIQGRSLGLDVQALSSDGVACDAKAGELVCRNPFPSRPLGFFGDDGRRFHDAYFSANPGMWTHGDLVQFDADGQARMLGRSDGVLLIRGTRVGPAEIYAALHDVPEVREAMAVEQRGAHARAEPRVVLLVVLREPAVLDGRLTVRIRREIVRNASSTHVPELIVQVDELPTTHSGKRSERAAGDALSGLPAANRDALRNPRSLDHIAQAVKLADERLLELTETPEVTEDAPTEARLRAIWEGVLGVAPLSPTDNFFDVGGTSLAAVRVFQAIHDRMGVDLPLSTLVRAQTTADMAAVIETPAERRIPSLVLLRPGRAEHPLFLVHSLTGDVLQLRSLALRLDTDRPVYGIQARGLDPAEEPHTRVEDMAESYVHSIRSVQPTGPYCVAGHSFGGQIAFELACRLSALGERVDWLGLIDAGVHPRCLPPLLRFRFRVAQPVRFLRKALGDPRTWLPRYLRKSLLRIAPSAPIVPPAPLWSLPPLLRRLERIGLQAFARYRPGDYEGSATFFLADVREPATCNPIPAWRRAVRGDLTVERIPGGHLNLIAEPHVQALAERVSAHLASTGQSSGQSPADDQERRLHAS